MHKLLFNFVLFCLLLPSSNALLAQFSAYNQIRKQLHDHKWYVGCPKIKGQFDQAFAEISEGSKEWEKLAHYYSGCLSEEGREIESIQYLQKALKIAPDNYQFLVNIGSSYMRMNDFQKAEEYFKKSNIQKPNRDAYYKLAHIHRVMAMRIADRDQAAKRAALLAEAEKEIKKVIELYNIRRKKTHRISRYAEAGNLTMLADIYNAQGNTEQSESLYRQIIDDVEKTSNWDPQRKAFALTELYFNLGQSLYIQERKAEGEVLMKKAIATAPTENVKSVKESLLELTINPARSKSEVQARYPYLKDGAIIPLY